MDADATVEPGRLEQPEVLVLVAALGQAVGRLDAFLFALCVFDQLGVDTLVVLVFVRFYSFHNSLELLDLLTDVVTQVVENDR